MREKLKAELTIIATLLPLYQKEALYATERFDQTKSGEDLTKFVHAVTAYKSKLELMEFLNRMLAESDDK